jgi:hypothetical protein
MHRVASLAQLLIGGTLILQHMMLLIPSLGANSRQASEISTFLLV